MTLKKNAAVRGSGETPNFAPAGRPQDKQPFLKFPQQQSSHRSEPFDRDLDARSVPAQRKSNSREISSSLFPIQKMIFHLRLSTKTSSERAFLLFSRPGTKCETEKNIYISWAISHAWKWRFRVETTRFRDDRVAVPEGDGPINRGVGRRSPEDAR